MRGVSTQSKSYLPNTNTYAFLIIYFCLYFFSYFRNDTLKIRPLNIFIYTEKIISVSREKAQAQKYPRRPNTGRPITGVKTPYDFLKKSANPENGV
jgi:hypothetical protein